MNGYSIALALVTASAALAPAASAQVVGVPEPPTLESAQATARAALVKSREDWTKDALGELRSALSIYYGDHEGRYPASLAELVPVDIPRDIPAELIPAFISAKRIPDYLPAIPTALLPGTGHAPTAKFVDLRDDVQDFAGLVRLMKDTGGWLYVANPRSPLFGTLVVDCLHRDSRGQEWWRY